MVRRCHEAAHFGGDRLELGGGEVGQFKLEFGETLAGKTRCYDLDALIIERGINAEQVGRLGPIFRVQAHTGFRVRFGAADLALNGFGIIGQIDA